MKIHVSRGKTINIGNFESEKIEVGIELNLDEDTDMQEVFSLLDYECKSFIEKKEEEILKDNGVRRRKK